MLSNHLVRRGKFLIVLAAIFGLTAAGNGLGASQSGAPGPTIAVLLNTGTIGLNSSTPLTYYLSNPNQNGPTAAGALDFTATLPDGLVVSTPNGLTNSCAGSSVTAVAGSSSVSLSGATLQAGASCSFSVNITGTSPGKKNISASLPDGAASFGNLNVIAPPFVTTTFSTSLVGLYHSVLLTIGMNNPNPSTALTGVGFTDNLPAGLVVSSPNQLHMNGSCGGTLAAAEGSSTVSLSGATVPAGDACYIFVSVTVNTEGDKVNSIKVASSNGGESNTAAASFSVAAPGPTIAALLNVSSIPLNGSTPLTLYLSNPDPGGATQAGALDFTMTLPEGLVVSTPSGLTGSCDGGIITATAGSSTVGLSGATLPAKASCSFSVNITGTSPGAKNITASLPDGALSAGSLTVGPAAATQPPSLSISFAASTIPLHGFTPLNFTLGNPDSSGPTSSGALDFTANLPEGLLVSIPNGLTGACGGGTVNANAATSVISLSGATLPAGASCSFSVNIRGASPGVKDLSISLGSGSAGSAELTVVDPPVITPIFNPASINVGMTAALTFIITNPVGNPVPLTGVGFTDKLPNGLTVASVLSTVCGGTLTVAGPTGITLSGATLAVNSKCQFTVTVTGAVIGKYTSTTGTVTSSNGGDGNTASASLSVLPSGITPPPPPPPNGNTPPSVTGSGSGGAGGSGSGGSGSGAGGSGGSGGGPNTPPNPSPDPCAAPNADPRACACQQRFMLLVQVVTSTAVNMAPLTERSNRSYNNGQGIRIPIVLRDDGTFQGYGSGADTGAGSERASGGRIASEFGSQVFIRAMGKISPGDCSTKPCKPDVMHLIMLGAAMPQQEQIHVRVPNLSTDLKTTDPGSTGSVQIDLPAYVGATGQQVFLNTPMIKSVMNVAILPNPSPPLGATAPGQGSSLLFSALECRLARDNPPANPADGGGSSRGGSSTGKSASGGSTGGASGSVPAGSALPPVNIVVNEKIQIADSVPGTIAPPAPVNIVVNEKIQMTEATPASAGPPPVAIIVNEKIRVADAVP